MNANLMVKKACFKTYQMNYGSDKHFCRNYPILNEVFKSHYLMYGSTHLLKNIRNIWQVEKIQKLKSKDPETEQTLIRNWSILIHIYKLENDSFVKLTKLNYATLCPSNFEKPKVSLTLDLEFNDKKDFAVFVHMITQLWNCLKIKAK